MNKYLFPMSSDANEWASEKMNERSGARERSARAERASEVSSAEQANECAVPVNMSGGANDPLLYASIS